MLIAASVVADDSRQILHPLGQWYTRAMETKPTDERGVIQEGMSQMNDRPSSWKVVIVGSAGAALDGSAFELLYPFQSKEEAEGHAACFSKTGTD